MKAVSTYLQSHSNWYPVTTGFDKLVIRPEIAVCFA